jgi:putative tryptophan/tyrosine transport system substrate-binding protein
MRRREFIAIVGGAMSGWPLAARSQQPSLPVIGFLHSASPEQNVKRVSAYLQGLKDGGFVDGQNVKIEYRWANGNESLLPGLAADLIGRGVAVIVTPGSTPAALVAKASTSTIPLVVTTGADPVALGVVASINHPGGNITGVSSMNADVAAKRLGVLKELVPEAAHYFTLINPTSPLAEPSLKDLQSGAASLGIHVEVLRASTDTEIDAAFAGLPQQADTALVFGPDQYFYSRRARIAALAAKHALPTVFDVRDYVDAGGLSSYGTDYFSVMQLAGDYTARILKGEKPGDLPFLQPTKFEMVLNLKTAKALGLNVPPSLLAIADDVVE